MFCKNCNKKTDNPKFCSRSCSVSYQHKIDSSPRNKRIRNYCVVCDKPHNILGDLCREHQFQQDFDKGLIKERSTLKRQLIKIRSRRCEHCEKTTWLDVPIPLELDHIDGNAGNNFPNNLRLLCPNCHALTPTAKAKNKGNGRKSRGLPLH